MQILPSIEHIPKEGKKSLIPQNNKRLVLEPSHASPEAKLADHLWGVTTENFNEVTKPDRKCGKLRPT